MADWSASVRTGTGSLRRWSSSCVGVGGATGRIRAHPWAVASCPRGREASGFAIWSRSAGHASRSGRTRHALGSKPDQPTGQATMSSGLQLERNGDEHLHETASECHRLPDGGRHCGSRLRSDRRRSGHRGPGHDRACERVRPYRRGDPQSRHRWPGCILHRRRRCGRPARGVHRRAGHQPRGIPANRVQPRDPSCARSANDCGRAQRFRGIAPGPGTRLCRLRRRSSRGSRSSRRGQVRDRIPTTQRTGGACRARRC